MKNSTLILALLATLTLVACDRTPTVVNGPSTPGPAGPQGATGSTGATGKTGDGTTVIVTPPASAPAN